MTYQTDCTLPEELLEQIAQEGLASLPTLIQTVVNQAMQIERQKYLGVGPYERSEERQGHANGYKPKTVATRVGNITFDVPQVREGGFYPQALEKGVRSERALKLALAEMYVQGVSSYVGQLSARDAAYRNWHQSRWYAACVHYRHQQAGPAPSMSGSRAAPVFDYLACLIPRSLFALC